MSMEKIAQSAIVRVYGFVMLQRVDEGKYRVKNLGDGTYQFYRPRGRKPLVRHGSGFVDPWIKANGEDLNGIEILEEIK